MHGEIISISRLRMATDGPGVSTLVAFFGCPLQCKYCANWICHEPKTPREIYSPKQLINVLKQDDIYFKMTGGGVVFGGGEPLLHADFIHDVCQLTDKLWKKRIETSLHAEWDAINLLIDDIDEWIVDIKDINPEIYKSYTGKDNDIVIKNLNKLQTIIPEYKVLIRIPHIPKANTSENIGKSIATIMNMGYSRIEQFEYIEIDANYQANSFRTKP